MLTVALLGCGSAAQHVEIQAAGSEGMPLAGLEIRVLPFDHVRLLDTLAATAEAPRPVFGQLEAEMADYRRPDQRTLDSVGRAWRAIRDSVQGLADSLERVGPQARGYAAAYRRLEESYQRLAQRAAEREQAMEAEVGTDRELALRAAAAADTLRRWEQAAFAGYGALAESAVARSQRPVHHIVTDDAGMATLSLERGRWWIVSRWWDPVNPFREYFWNVPLKVGWFGPRRVLLDLEAATTRWRH